MIMICHFRFINYNQCTTLVGDGDNQGSYSFLTAGIYGKFLYLPFHFAAKLNAVISVRMSFSSISSVLFWRTFTLGITSKFHIKVGPFLFLLLLNQEIKRILASFPLKKERRENINNTIPLDCHNNFIFLMIEYYIFTSAKALSQVQH